MPLWQVPSPTHVSKKYGWMQGAVQREPTILKRGQKYGIIVPLKDQRQSIVTTGQTNGPIVVLEMWGR
jgi:hypothetical protein